MTPREDAGLILAAAVAAADARAAALRALRMEDGALVVADAERIPLASVDRAWVVLAHSDHVAHLERTAAFIHAVTSFLERPGAP